MINYKSSLSHPVIGKHDEFYWPESELVPSTNPAWPHANPGPDGNCFCCHVAFTYYVFDVLVDKPNKFALVCISCFWGLDLQVGEKKGQMYYRTEKSKWRAIPEGEDVKKFYID